MRTFPRLARAAAPLNHQSHHIIPVGVFAGRAFAAHFDALSFQGFDARQFHRNGVFLPATEGAACRCIGGRTAGTMNSWLIASMPFFETSTALVASPAHDLRPFIVLTC